MLVLSVTNNLSNLVFLGVLLGSPLLSPELRSAFLGCCTVYVGAVGRAAPT